MGTSPPPAFDAAAEAARFCADRAALAAADLRVRLARFWRGVERVSVAAGPGTFPGESYLEHEYVELLYVERLTLAELYGLDGPGGGLELLIEAAA